MLTSWRPAGGRPLTRLRPCTARADRARRGIPGPSVAFGELRPGVGRPVPLLVFGHCRLLLKARPAKGALIHADGGLSRMTRARYTSSPGVCGAQTRLTLATGSESLMGTVIVINSDRMGSGDRELGRKILATCLRKLSTFKDLEAVVLYNAGVLLATDDSYVAPELRLLDEAGVDIHPCGTCVEHYGIGDRLIVDRPSNMDEILATMQAASRVITL